MMLQPATNPSPTAAASLEATTAAASLEATTAAASLEAVLSDSSSSSDSSESSYNEAIANGADDPYDADEAPVVADVSMTRRNSMG